MSAGLHVGDVCQLDVERVVACPGDCGGRLFHCAGDLVGHDADIECLWFLEGVLDGTLIFVFRESMVN